MSSTAVRPSSAVIYEIDATLGPLKGGCRPATPRCTPNGPDVEEYRVGGPGLPLLPEPTKPWIVPGPRGARIKEFNHMLSTAEQSYEGTHFVYVKTKWHDGCLDTWIPAADAMHLKLKELNSEWLKLLIADNRALHKPRTGGIEPGEHAALLPDWGALSNQVRGAMAPNRNFTTLDLLTRQRVWDHGDDPKKVKVCQGIDYQSEVDWESAVERTEAVINANNTYRKYGVELEIVRDRLWGRRG
ncbi:hypothetical protein H2200_011865 [Cladophialophora chaetospira]|uniref:Uncharacterized protein n=1 Tax=Cladophialophora chaetospira TaxID=386627 RepID=A0AA39CCX5_9EURO|nr:hypothetical protein H2200_011865 [Cladophialophora chaetospira]